MGPRPAGAAASERFVLAADGGNSKTDLALASVDGALLALVRGPTTSPRRLGSEGCVATLGTLRGQALEEAQLDAGATAELAALLLAGVDFPEDERELERLVASRGWARRPLVRNDTFAVLRAGSERGWGVVVVAGVGINCIGVAPDRRQVRFSGLGAVSGDWGGSVDVGQAALAAAARSADGRGPPTSLERAVPRSFGMTTVAALGRALDRGELPMERLAELAPLVFSEASRDAAAAAIVDRLAGEVVDFARAALVRLELTRQPVEVLLGGGLLQAGNRRLLHGIVAGLRELGDEIVLHVNSSRPIVGAALMALDEIGADADARTRLRRELEAAAERLGDVS
jgi:N-acetylglucosamine kinase-like BadF-type ATPase